jgi:DNA-binding MarR family transcriptional regulator
VELTDQGVVLFDALRQVAVAHDARLRSGLTEAETELLAELLDKLRSGRGSDAEGHGSTR